MREYFLETNRIGFSHWTKDDIGLAISLWGEQEVTKYISKTGRFSKQEIADRLLLEITNENQFGVQYWPIFEKATNNYIGCCGFRPYRSEKHAYEIGFHLKSNYWGKGLGTEAASAMIHYSFTTLNASALFAGHHPDNALSKKVLEKLGFDYIGDEYYEPTELYHPSYRFSGDAYKKAP